MPELTARNIAFTVLIVAAAAAVLAAVALLANQDDNAPIRIIAPSSLPNQEEIPTVVRVYVNGAVVSPGVYALDSESRIADAIDAAGGLTSEGTFNGLNLALRVTDEAEYRVLKQGETPSVGSTGSQSTTGDAAFAGGLININLASAALLDTLPGIGPVLAQAIVDYRENVRPFRSIAEIQEVPKIGPGTFEDIRNLILVP
ncbi:MAG: ComEA family DNA-binding protein [Chloroflexi bacterium]|nr:ComEA family DNA-binding protein [Chloroflexota bacterium]